MYRLAVTGVAAFDPVRAAGVDVVTMSPALSRRPASTPTWSSYSNHRWPGGHCAPTGEQKTFAAKLPAAVVGLILGSCAHTLQLPGWLGHPFVAYRLANVPGTASPSVPTPVCWS